MARRAREQHPDQWRNTPRYLRLRARVLAEQPLCVLCLARGDFVVMATEMDHTRPVAFGGARWDRSQRARAVCSPCHAAQVGHRAPNVDETGLADLYSWHDFD